MSLHPLPLPLLSLPAPPPSLCFTSSSATFGSQRYIFCLCPFHPPLIFCARFTLSRFDVLAYVVLWIPENQVLTQVLFVSVSIIFHEQTNKHTHKSRFCCFRSLLWLGFSVLNSSLVCSPFLFLSLSFSLIQMQTEDVFTPESPNQGSMWLWHCNIWSGCFCFLMEI